MQRHSISSKDVLAVRLGVSRSTLFRAMAGDEPAGRLIAALNIEFGVCIDDLVEAVPAVIVDSASAA